ncbi:MFS transporter [Streptomyces sp. NPDC097619]|uniref:MFS transporter n=1 Tax=Streptomyces sp. NPDC097619 TaxID=3157228 RepID=UPI00332B3B81
MTSSAPPGTRGTGRVDLGRPFRRLWASAAASNAGDGVTRTLLPLLVVAHHPEPAAVAGLTAVNMLPWLLFALPAGVLADRADRRRLVLLSNAVRAAALTAAALLLAQDGPLPVLYALAFLLGTAETVADTAAPAMLPRLVEERHLERANGRLSAAQIVLGETAGPPLAGLLVGLTAAAALATGGALYALAAVFLLGLTPLARPGPTAGRTTGPPSDAPSDEPSGGATTGPTGGQKGGPEGGPSGGGPAPGDTPPDSVAPAPSPFAGVLTDIREGVRFVLHHRTLRLTLAASALYGLVFSATFSMLVLLSDGTLGLDGTGYGLLLAAGSLGAVAGSWLAPRAAERLPTVPLARWSLVASGVAYALIGAAPGPVTTGLALALNGVFMMGWNIPVMSLRQRLAPEHLRGRVMSVSRLCSWGTMPVGAVLGGLLAEVLSVPAVFVVSGLVLAAGALLLLAPLRDTPAPAVPAAASTTADAEPTDPTSAPHPDRSEKE